MPTSPPKNSRFVFICGLHRSGTSLLHSILGAHPDISFFHGTGAPRDEGQHLQDVYPSARAFGGPGKFCFAPEARLTEDSPLVGGENRAKLLAQWGSWWDMEKPVLVEKSPPNIIRSRFLQAMFPGSRFIFIVRHPVPVSFATEKLSRGGVPGLPSLVEHWVRAHEIWLEDRTQLQHCLSLRYEELVTSPADAMQRLAAFLGIKHWPLSERVDAGINERYFKHWETYKAASPAAHQTIAGMAALPKIFGYSFAAPYVAPPPEVYR